MADGDEGRRKALGGVHIEKRKPRQRPCFPSERSRVKATWDVSPELRARIKTKAKELGVNQYTLVEKILTDGLDRIDSGNWELKKIPVKIEYDLE